MALPLDALQLALYERLAGRILVAGAAVSVYDFAPLNEPRPFISLGMMRADMETTADNQVASVEVGIRIESAAEGSRELYELVSQIDDALCERPLDLSSSGARDLGSHFVSLDTFERETADDRVVREAEYRRRYLVSTT